MELWILIASAISVLIAGLSLYLTVKQNKKIHNDNIKIQK
jgi:hypothetical protein